MIRSGQTLFTYFHFAADRKLTEAMLESGASCLAYETLRDNQGRLPLLTPMSEVAGRMSIQEGAKFLERPQMGRGILLGGVPGVAPAHITILGGGVVGTNAARIAAGFRADVAILDINLDRLRYLDDVMPPNVNALFSDRHTIRDQLRRADLVIGSVLIPGAKAPYLVRKEDLKLMKQGSPVLHAQPCHQLAGTLCCVLKNFDGIDFAGTRLGCIASQEGVLSGPNVEDDPVLAVALERLAVS